jgi:cysteinyl-tRNA synthetase
MIKKIIEVGLGYEVDGSVYFDVIKYSKTHEYGKLSGRVLEDLLSNTRDLEGQSEKRNPADFALWKKAQPEHIMRWPSPWSDGFPGWHLECSAMSTKYLGLQFDIHGGGMDLLFPHHECEIAQSMACNGKDSVKYWLHNNMITINGQKMGKSLGNFIILDDFFTGDNKLLEQAYSPMTIRFFILQANYRSTLDFSNEALQSAEKGLKKLMTAFETLENLKTSETSTSNIKDLEKKCYEAMNDDFNSPILIAHLFEGVRIINSVNDAKEIITAEDLTLLKKLFKDFAFEILGLKNESAKSNNDLPEKLMDVILNLRQTAKTNKDFATSDKIRDELKNINIVIKDTKDGAVWNLED